MTRVKRGTTVRQKHKAVLERTKGFRMNRSKNIRVAKEADFHAGQYAFAGRKLRKRDMRRMWILRIGQALSKHDITYSKFIYALKEKKIELNRKSLSLLIREHPEVFDHVVKHATK